MMMPPCAVHSAKSPWHQMSGKAREIGVVIFLAVGIVPEHRPASRGTAWCRRARLSRRAPACPSSSNTSTAMPSIGALDLAAPNRRQRIAADKAAADIGAARDRGEMNIGLDRLIDEIETLGARAASRSRAWCAERESLWVSRGRKPDFFTASIYLAEVPKIVIPPHRQNRKARRSLGWKGEPS